MPVESGVKYAANFWTHLRDFQASVGIRGRALRDFQARVGARVRALTLPLPLPLPLTLPLPLPLTLPLPLRLPLHLTLQTPHKFNCASPQPSATRRRKLHEQADG